MKKLGIVMVMGLLMAAFIVPAGAMEFTVKGQYNWDWRTIHQLGDQGFFGRWDTNVGGPPGSERMNFWTGLECSENAVTRADIANSKDAAIQYNWMVLKPQFRINKAIRIRGSYRIGSFWAPQAFLNTQLTTLGPFAGGNIPGGAFNGASPQFPSPTPWMSIVDGAPLPFANASKAINSYMSGTNYAFSPGYWETLWLTAQTPWGIIALGKRPSPAGMGLLMDGNETSTESLALVAPYGPLTFVIFTYPWRTSDALGGLAGHHFNHADSDNQKNLFEAGAVIQYNAGPLQVGVLFDYNGRWRNAFGAGSQRTHDWIGITWMKYNNGRFFANAEVAHYDRLRRHDRRPTGGTWYIEDWRYAAEVGFVAGPAKLSLLGAWLSGPDRRAGLLIDRSPAQFANGGLIGNNVVFRPYSYLMVHSYATGTGANALVNEGKGSFTDGWFAGARLDYSVAANLNTYITACYAERNSSGYGWGYAAPADVAGHSTLLNAFETPGFTWAILGPNTPFNRLAPAIPDKTLGWEFDAGFDWKLLEGLTVKLDTAIWFPGKWFSYAFVDRGVNGWHNVGLHNAANNWGTNPGRTIDPVFGTTLKVEANF